MKKLMLLAFLCLSFVASHAAVIINTTGCSLTLQPVCYNPPPNCLAIVPCGPVIHIPGGGGPVPLPPPCGCPLQGYTICYSPGFPGCAGICVNISDAAGGPCFNFPIAAVLPPCPACGNRPFNIFWDPAGNLIIM